MTRQWPEIPVVLVDTGYLFPETYRFIDELTERLQPQPQGLPARAEPGLAGGALRASSGSKASTASSAYNRMNKVEPMQRASTSSTRAAGSSASGARRPRRDATLNVLGIQDGYLKVHPIVDWNDKHVYDYLTRYDLPYHPLWEQGYLVDRRLAHVGTS